MSPSEAEEPPTEIFDSLPYYDNDLDKFPDLRQKVEQELAREPKHSQTLHPRVPPAMTLFAVRRSIHVLKTVLLTTIIPEQSTAES